MIAASLPMYDWPEIRQATDAFWACLAWNAGIKGALQRGADFHAAWRDPNLKFSQTCGYPFTHEFKGLVNYVATPHYACAGCHDANYSSFVLAREVAPLASFRGKIAAVNNPDSMSGMLALKLAVAPYANDGQFFAGCITTGSHLNSLKALREGTVDVCAVDAVCVALAEKHRPQDLKGLYKIGQTPMVPGLPFVTRFRNLQQLRLALEKTFADPGLKSARNALLLRGFSVLPESAYDRIVELERSVERFEL